jgi:hypothetical protein
MGLFQSIGDLANTGFQKSRRRLERAQANKAISDVTRAQEFRKREDPREQAHLKQSAWARGLGKSSIEEQDRDRLTGMQKDRNDSLDSALHLAVLNKRYIKKKHKHEKVSMWLGLIDGIISLAAGAGGGSAPQLGNPEQSGSANGAMQYGWGTYEY